MLSMRGSIPGKKKFTEKSVIPLIHIKIALQISPYALTLRNIACKGGVRECSGCNECTLHTWCYEYFMPMVLLRTRGSQLNSILILVR